MGQVFEQELEILRTEAEEVAQYLYAYLAIHATAAQNSEVVRLLNTAPLFWNTTLGALQTSAFIAMGRVFDDDKNSHGVNRLLNLAKENLQIFTRNALAARRQGKNPIRPEYLDKFLLQVYIPELVDFQELQEKVDEHKEIYKNKYKSIRNKIYAHKDIVSNINIHDLFAQTDMHEWQTLTLFLQSLHNLIWQLYHNGIKLDLQGNFSSIENVLSHLIPAGQQVPPQEKIAHEVTNFLLTAAEKR